MLEGCFLIFGLKDLAISARERRDQFGGDVAKRFEEGGFQEGTDDTSYAHPFTSLADNIN
jgi:hypothetical protein